LVDRFFSDLDQRVIIGVFIALCILGVYLLTPHGSPVAIQQTWSTQVDHAGNGTPVLVDVNEDGTLDSIVGFGKRYGDAKGGVVALDGQTGEVLWKTLLEGEVNHAPVAIDVTKDGVPDLVVTGQFADMVWLDGQTGKVIRSLKKHDPNRIVEGVVLNAPTLVNDIDSDGFRDIVVLQGSLAPNSTYLTVHDANTKAPIITTFDLPEIRKNIHAYLEKEDSDEQQLMVCKGGRCKVKTFHRSIFVNYTLDWILYKLTDGQVAPASKVLVVSSRTGKLLGRWQVPEGRVSLTSAAHVPINGGVIVYGTGGAQKGGQLVAQHIKTGEILWSIDIPDKGIMGTPVTWKEHDKWVVAVGTMRGTVLKSDLRSGKVLWQTQVAESHEIRVGVRPIVTAKGTDIIVWASKGEMPLYTATMLSRLNGETGRVRDKKVFNNCGTAVAPWVLKAKPKLFHTNVVASVVCHHGKGLAELRLFSDTFRTIGRYPLKSTGMGNAVVMQKGNLNIDIVVPRAHYIDRLRLSTTGYW
jgi:outer membrane protein assembly factor BamB